MSDTVLELHHTAYRVPDIEASMRAWCDRLGARIEVPPTLVSADQVLVAFLTFAGGRVELVQAVDSPRRTAAPGRPDHVCFLCTDFDARIQRAREDGSIVARPAVPSEAFGMRRMCFLLLPDLGLVEFVEK